MSLKILKKQLENATIFSVNDYKYIINSITEQEPALEPSILEDAANRLLKKLNYKNCTKILTPEAMGISIATVISLKTNIPMIIATKRKKRVKNEISVYYRCGYKKDVLHINNIQKDDKILIIDDLISTGGTVIALIKEIEKIGANVEDIGVIFSKEKYKGIKKLKKMNHSPKVLLNIKFINNQIKVEKC